MGCPTEKPSVPTPIVRQQQPIPIPAESLQYQQPIQHHVQLPYDSAVYARQEKEQINWQPSGHQLIPQQEMMQYPQQVVKSQPQVNLGSQRYQPEYQPLYEQNKGTFNSMNTYRGQNNVNPYERKFNTIQVFIVDRHNIYP